MKDRNVEFPYRYKLQKVTGTDDVYDLIPAPGDVTEPGTPINKSTLLTDDTASEIWTDESSRPEDPTVNEALERIVSGASILTKEFEVAEGITVTAPDVVNIENGKITKRIERKIVEELHPGTAVSASYISAIAGSTYLGNNKFVFVFNVARNTTPYLVEYKNGELSLLNIGPTVSNGSVDSLAVRKIDDNRFLLITEYNAVVYSISEAGEIKLSSSVALGPTETEFAKVVELSYGKFFYTGGYNSFNMIDGAIITIDEDSNINISSRKTILSSAMPSRSNIIKLSESRVLVYAEQTSGTDSSSSALHRPIIAAVDVAGTSPTVPITYTTSTQMEFPALNSVIDPDAPAFIVSESKAVVIYNSPKSGVGTTEEHSVYGLLSRTITINEDSIVLGDFTHIEGTSSKEIMSCFARTGPDTAICAQSIGSGQYYVYTLKVNQDCTVSLVHAEFVGRSVYTLVVDPETSTTIFGGLEASGPLSIFIQGDVNKSDYALAITSAGAGERAKVLFLGAKEVPVKAGTEINTPFFYANAPVDGLMWTQRNTPSRILLGAVENYNAREVIFDLTGIDLSMFSYLEILGDSGFGGTVKMRFNDLSSGFYSAYQYVVYGGSNSTTSNYGAIMFLGDAYREYSVHAIIYHEPGPFVICDVRSKVPGTSRDQRMGSHGFGSFAGEKIKLEKLTITFPGASGNSIKLYGVR